MCAEIFLYILLISWWRPLISPLCGPWGGLNPAIEQEAESSETRQTHRTKMLKKNNSDQLHSQPVRTHCTNYCIWTLLNRVWLRIQELMDWWNTLHCSWCHHPTFHRELDLDPLWQKACNTDWGVPPTAFYSTALHFYTSPGLIM